MNDLDIRDSNAVELSLSANSSGFVLHIYYPTTGTTVGFHGTQAQAEQIWDWFTEGLTQPEPPIGDGE